MHVDLFGVKSSYHATRYQGDVFWNGNTHPTNQQDKQDSPVTIVDKKSQQNIEYIHN
jgi:hypothetical protein